MDIKTLSQLGRVEKEIELNKELRVKLHTLSALEQQTALSSVPENIENVAARFAMLQVSVLTQAVDSINGEAISKDQAKELFNTMQYSILSDLFTAYSEMSNEQTQVMEELKKK